MNPTNSRIPVSLRQRLFWTANQLNPSAQGQNTWVSLKLGESMHAEAVEAGIADVITRHEILHCTFPDEFGIPEIRNAQGAISPLVVSDASENIEAAAFRDAIEQPFDLRSQLPIRSYLYNLQTGEQVVLLVIHQIAIDAWSLRVLCRDLIRAFTARRANTAPRWRVMPRPYTEYSLRQQTLLGDPTNVRSAIARAMDLWSSSPGIVQPAWPHEGGGLTAQMDVRANRMSFSIPRELHARLSELAASESVSLLDILQAAVGASLTRLGLASDVFIGAVLSGREAEFTNTIGLFENAVLMRPCVTRDSTFRDALQRTHANSTSALEMPYVPFEYLVESVEAQTRHTERLRPHALLSLHQAAEMATAVGLKTGLEPASSFVHHSPISASFAEYRENTVPAGMLGVVAGSSKISDRFIKDFIQTLCGLLAASTADIGQTVDVASAVNETAIDWQEVRSEQQKPRSETPGQPRICEDLSSLYLAPLDSLEAQLVDLWEDLLEIHPVGVTDDFFELGGDAELAARMLAAVEDSYGRRPSMPFLDGNMTIQKLADDLVQGLPPVESLRIQKGNSESISFFFLHGDLISGGLFSLPMTRALGIDQTVDLLQPHGLNGKAVPHTLEEMAEDYVATVRRIQPNGPYCLGGYCNGAVIAFETARQLVSRGQEVAALLLICGQYSDSPPPKRMPSQPSRDRMQSLRLQRAGRFFQYARSVGRYRPQWYSGKVDLFWPREEPGKPTIAMVKGGTADIGAAHVVEPAAPPDARWRRVAADVELHYVPGNHATCITRYAADLGESLEHKLAAIRNHWIPARDKRK